MSETPVSHAELVDRARSIAPLLAREGRISEELRHPSDAAIEAMVSAEIFELMVPTRYGGHGLDMPTFVDVVLALAEGDAALAWVASFLIEHNWMLCCFPESFQKELYADRSHVQAPAMVSPTGRARPATGGAVLSGRWAFATGVWHSSWVMCSGILDRGADGMDVRLFALPRDEVRIEDTWHVDGMAGTGSHDVVVEEVFVPIDRSLSMLEMATGSTPGSDLHDHPLYRTPMAPLLYTAAAMPSLGRVRSAVREFAQRLPERRRMGSPHSQAGSVQQQARLARLSIEIEQAELLLRRAVESLCERRADATATELSRMQAQIALVVHQSAAVMRCLSDAAGASAHALSDPLQRARRDVDTMTCHFAFDLDRALENAGRTMLGMPAIPVGG